MKSLVLSTSTFRYDPETGRFFNQMGREIGHTDGRYITLTVDGRKIYAHRLAWRIVYGYWPEQVDHINRERDDNRISNLREVNDSQQRMNCTKALGSSGIRGVGWFKPKGKWRARIKKNRREVHLGYFRSKKKASLAYQQARKRLFGEFCPT